MAHDAFISYSSKDKPTADAVCATLESRGIRCWIAPRDVLPGEEYAASIINAIHASRILVLVFSSGANQSPQVLREVERGVSRGLPILPLRIENVSPSASMEYYISSQHWLDALTEPMERHLVLLADTVKLLLARMSSSAVPVEPPPAVKPVPPVIVEEPVAPPRGEIPVAPKVEVAPAAPPSKPPVATPEPPKKAERPKEIVPPLPQVANQSRGRIAMAAVFMQLVLGAYYAWGSSLGHLMSAFHWASSQVSILFGASALTFGVACLIGGLWLRKSGARKLASTSAILYGGGIFLSAFSGSFGASLVWFLFTYCFLASVGLGFGYIVSVTVLLQWFPDKRGFVAGLTGAAFGLGAVILSPLISGLMNVFGISVGFVVLGIVSLIAVLVAGRFLQEAPTQPGVARSFTLREALGRWQWYALCAILFVSVGTSISLLSEGMPMAQEIGGAGASMIGFFVLGDPLGQFLSGWISDRISRPRLLLVLLILQCFLLLILAATHSPVFTVLLFLILFANGGCQAALLAFAADCFGSDHIAAVFGMMQAVAALAVVFGPLFVAQVHEGTGSRAPTMYIFAVLMLAVAFLPLAVRPSRMIAGAN